jgi:hypothetical protein
MKALLLIPIVASLAACSTVKSVNPDEAIRNQKLSTNFTDDKIKIETDCIWYKPWKSDCNIVAIEATASTWTNGGTRVQVSSAREVAEMQALAKMARFIKEDVTTNRVVETVAKHIEKAQDRIAKGDSGDSTMTDKEAKATNISTRENANDTARTVTSTVKTNSQAILRGYYVKDSGKSGDQEVYVTVRWDLNSGRAAETLGKRFSR